jgi:glycopeptide antibiotics resistance protein
MIIGIFCSVAIELVQYYLPYRSFNFYDMLFNVVGLLFGYLVFIGVNLKIEEALSCNKKDEKYDYY